MSSLSPSDFQRLRSEQALSDLKRSLSEYSEDRAAIQRRTKDFLGNPVPTHETQGNLERLSRDWVNRCGGAIAGLQADHRAEISALLPSELRFALEAARAEESRSNSSILAFVFGFLLLILVVIPFLRSCAV